MAEPSAKAANIEKIVESVEKKFDFDDIILSSGNIDVIASYRGVNVQIGSDSQILGTGIDGRSSAFLFQPRDVSCDVVKTAEYLPIGESDYEERVVEKTILFCRV